MELYLYASWESDPPSHFISSNAISQEVLLYTLIDGSLVSFISAHTGSEVNKGKGTSAAALQK